MTPEEQVEQLTTALEQTKQLVRSQKIALATWLEYEKEVEQRLCQAEQRLREAEQRLAKYLEG